MGRTRTGMLRRWPACVRCSSRSAPKLLLLLSSGSGARLPLVPSPCAMALPWSCAACSPAAIGRSAAAAGGADEDRFSAEREAERVAQAATEPPPETARSSGSCNGRGCALGLSAAGDSPATQASWRPHGADGSAPRMAGVCASGRRGPLPLKPAAPARLSTLESEEDERSGGAAKACCANTSTALSARPRVAPRMPPLALELPPPKSTCSQRGAKQRRVAQGGHV